jgi:hypothetical protein
MIYTFFFNNEEVIHIIRYQVIKEEFQYPSVQQMVSEFKSLKIWSRVIQLISTLGVKCIQFINIVTCRPIARERLGKHIPAATNTQAKIE